MIHIIYEDEAIIVVEKPVGMEAQSSRGFAKDMVSEIQKHIHKLCPSNNQPYIGVIHRLDKPVGGVMVYGKTKSATAALSKQIQEHKMKKKYLAVACGQLVENHGVYVDYLLKNGENNYSQIVDKCKTLGKKAELIYRVLATKATDEGILSLIEIELKTGRHHQIRVQLAAHQTPLWGDFKYNPLFAQAISTRTAEIALFAHQLVFDHPITKQQMIFRQTPEAIIFKNFNLSE